MMGNEATLAGDEIKTRYSIDILHDHKPGFMTIHLSSLDELSTSMGHSARKLNKRLRPRWHGRASGQSRSRGGPSHCDSRRVGPRLCSKSDPPRQPGHTISQAGLIETSGEGDDRSTTGWKAQLWTVGGMAAVILHDRDDKQAAQQTGDLLHSLAADPKNGIAAVFNHDEIASSGEAFRTRLFWLSSSPVTTRATKSPARYGNAD